jgi:uncharacterized glyoxalase superfamily protein PhnB
MSDRPTQQPPQPAAALIPFVRYPDAERGLDFLSRAFGFEVLECHRTPDGKVAHAELLLGPAGACLMVGSGPEAHHPGAVGFDLAGVSSGIYAYVPDVDAHHARAVAAGARVLRPLADTSYGAREYTAQDPGGHVWSFGSYLPRAR